MTAFGEEISEERAKWLERMREIIDKIRQECYEANETPEDSG
jgi:hypothetical protein